MSAVLKTYPSYRGIVVSRYFFQEVTKTFPAIRENDLYRNFLWYILFGGRYDNGSGYLLLCRKKLAALAETSEENFCVEKFLCRFQEDVLRGETFRWTR